MDEYFPPVGSSIIPDDPDDPSIERTPKKFINEYRTYTFYRANEIYNGKEKVFEKWEDINNQDIVQGSMASCYLIVALSGLSRIPSRIKNLFLNIEINKNGVYGMMVYLQGEPTNVIVDDHFPCKNKNVAFSTTYKGSEIWVQIVEKVWGKVNRSCYLRTFLGTPQEALCFLSPAPTIYISHKSTFNSNEMIWNKITNAFKRNWVVCTNTEEIEDQETTGLVRFHAYAVLGVYELKGGEIKLLKLRNPWGNKNWKGRWSENCKNWTPKLRKQVDSFLREGSFFIEFNDFIKYFPWTFFCKIEDSWHYHYLKEEITYKNLSLKRNQIVDCKNITADLNKQMISGFIQVTKKSKVYVCLHQPQRRFLSDLDTNMPIPYGCLFVFKYEKIKSSEVYYPMDTLFINHEKIYLELDLDIGEYHIFGFSHISQLVKYPLVLSSYAEYPLIVYPLEKKEIVRNWLITFLKGLAINNGCYKYFDIYEPTSFYILMIHEDFNNSGFGFLYYENNSISSLMHVDVDFLDSEDGTVLNIKPFYKNFYRLVIKPGKSKFILIKMHKRSTINCKFNWKHNVHFSYTSEKIVKDFKESKSTRKFAIEKKVDLYQIRYKRGFVFLVVNNSKFNYSFAINFPSLKSKYKIERESEFTLEKHSRRQTDNTILQPDDSSDMYISCDSVSPTPTIKLNEKIDVAPSSKKTVYLLSRYIIEEEENVIFNYKLTKN